MTPDCELLGEEGIVGPGTACRERFPGPFGRWSLCHPHSQLPQLPLLQSHSQSGVRSPDRYVESVGTLRLMAHF